MILGYRETSDEMERQSHDLVVGCGIRPIAEKLKIDALEVAPCAAFGRDQCLFQGSVRARDGPELQLSKISRLARCESKRLDCNTRR